MNQPVLKGVLLWDSFLQMKYRETLFTELGMQVQNCGLKHKIKHKVTT